jgi:hypothetical protein
VNYLQSALLPERRPGAPSSGSLAVLALFEFPSGLGACDDGVETLRIRMTLMAGVPEVDAPAALLGAPAHRAIDSWRWAGREQMTNESNPEQ